MLPFLMVQRLKEVGLGELQEAYQKVLFWFFSFPSAETGLNDLSAEMRISKTTAKRVINRLVEEGFLKVKVYGNAWRITCNQEHIYNHSLKIVHNLDMVYRMYWLGLRDMILQRVGNPSAVILFGSYRKGDDTKESDIDLAVEVLGDASLRIEPLAIVESFGFRKNVPVNLHIFSRKRVDMNLFSNITNGIVLEGFLEVGP